MIHASKALEMTKENIKKEAEAVQAKVEKFIEEDCQSAILESIEKRMYDAFVKIPTGLFNTTSLIISNLTANGYKAQVRHGSEPTILIMWK